LIQYIDAHNLPQKSQFRAERDLRIAIMFCHQEILNRKIQENILNAYPRSFEIAVQYARLSRFLKPHESTSCHSIFSSDSFSSDSFSPYSASPDLPEENSPSDPYTFLELLEQSSKLDWFSRHIFLTLKHYMPPQTDYEKETYTKFLKEIRQNVLFTIENAKLLFSQILSEITLALPGTASSFNQQLQSSLNLFYQFSELYPNSPDGLYFARILNAIYPNCKEIKLLISILKRKTQFMKSDFSTFHSHISLMFHHSKYLQDFDLVYPSSKDLEMNLQPFSNSSNFSKIYVGPFSSLLTNFFSYFILFVGFGVPMVVLIYFFEETNVLETRSEYLIETSKIFGHIHYFIVYALPLYLLPENSSFFTDTFARRDFSLQFLSFLDEYQSILYDVNYGFFGIHGYDEVIFKRVNQFFFQPYQDSNFQDGTFLFFFFDNFHSFLLQLISDDKKQFLDFQSIDQLHQIFSNKISVFENEYVNFYSDFVQSSDIKSLFSPKSVAFYFFMIFLSYLLIIFFLVITSYVAVNRFNLFFTTLKETSKVAANQYLKDLDDLIGSFHHQKSTEKQHTRFHIYSTTKCLYLLIFIIFSIFVIISIFFYLLFNCCNFHCSQIFDDRKEFQDIINHLLKVFRYYFIIRFHPSLTQENFDFYQKSINSSLYIEKLSHPNQISVPFLCPYCSNVELYSYNFIYPSNFETVFLSVLSSLFLYSKHFNYFTLNQIFDVLRFFYESMIPNLISFQDIQLSEYHQNLNSIKYAMIGLIVSYVFFVVIFVFILFSLINYFDLPFKVIIRLLSNLKSGSVSNKTLSLIQTKNIDINSVQLKFENSFFDSVFNQNDFAVIIVNKSLDITFHNKRAESIINFSDNSVNNLRKPLKIDLLSIPELKRIPQILDGFFLEDTIQTIQYELSGKTPDCKEFFFL
jgi:hypothetical protein